MKAVDIYVAYVVETYRYDDDNSEKQNTIMLRAFCSRDAAKKWAQKLHEQALYDSKEYGKKFFWNESESKDDYSINCTEYWDGNSNTHVESFAKCTIRYETKVESIEMSDEVSDPSEDIMCAMVG